MTVLAAGFVESSPLLIAVIDRDLNVVSLSPPWRETVGNDLDRLNVDGLFQELQFTPVSKLVADVLKTKTFVQSLAVT